MPRGGTGGMRRGEILELLDDLPGDTVEELTERALLHVSTLNLGAHAFDAVKGFFQRRDLYPPVKLMIAEVNEAVLKSLAKGRCPKLRHVARTHRVNLDWCYDLFRRPEIEATYVQTLYQIADLGTKAITKGEIWDRLTALMGIKAPGIQSQRARADVCKNKAGLETSSKAAQNIGEQHLAAAALALRPMLTRQVRSLLPPRHCRLCGIQGTNDEDCLNCPEATARPPGPKPEDVGGCAPLPSTATAPLGPPSAVAARTDKKSRSGRRRALRRAALPATTALDLT